MSTRPDDTSPDESVGQRACLPEGGNHDAFESLTNRAASTTIRLEGSQAPKPFGQDPPALAAVGRSSPARRHSAQTRGPKGPGGPCLSSSATPRLQESPAYASGVAPNATARRAGCPQPGPTARRPGARTRLNGRRGRRGRMPSPRTLHGRVAPRFSAMGPVLRLREVIGGRAPWITTWMRVGALYAAGCLGE